MHCEFILDLFKKYNTIQTIIGLKSDTLGLKAGVAELVDAPDLGSGAARRGGSSPFTRTIFLLVQAQSFFWINFKQRECR